MKITRRGILQAFAAAIPAAAIAKTATAATPAVIVVPRGTNLHNGHTIWLHCGVPGTVRGLGRKVHGLSVSPGYPYPTQILRETEGRRGTKIWPDADHEHVVFNPHDDEFYFADGNGNYLLIVDKPTIGERIPGTDHSPARWFVDNRDDLWKLKWHARDVAFIREEGVYVVCGWRDNFSMGVEPFDRVAWEREMWGKP